MLYAMTVRSPQPLTTTNDRDRCSLGVPLAGTCAGDGGHYLEGSPQ